jgi:outer membrane protein OmpA-like peptidoglycan-associated protein
MIGSRIVLKRGSRDEAEKPFWISYADLMTALMMLFLVTMSVTLLAVTKTVSESERSKVAREQDIERLLEKVAKAAEHYGVTVDRARNVIDFGDRARFDTARHALTTEQAKLLRSFVPEVLAVARDPLGRRWMKRIAVEGFADQRGSYLFNLNLSMQRSQRVLCVLLAPPIGEERGMNAEEREQIRELFLVGGYSFNSAKASLEASRRIELRLEFFGVNEERLAIEGIQRSDFGKCSLES